MTVKEFAPAKINLSLHVTGQRGDGLHLLDSLVCFADIGDWVTLEGAQVTSLDVNGIGAAAIPKDGQNLVLQAAQLFPDTCQTAITLEKDLPIAAGLGGGSADAAATLRAMTRLWDARLPTPEQQLALGADVPVCVKGRPVQMLGIGEDLDDVPTLPDMAVVLVNAGSAVPTGPVFQALDQKQNSPINIMPDRFSGVSDFIAWLSQQRNDLFAPATAVNADIAAVLAALEARDPLLSRMSGSGGTCFALFADLKDAQNRAADLTRRFPGWWIRAGKILA